MSHRKTVNNSTFTLRLNYKNEINYSSPKNLKTCLFSNNAMTTNIMMPKTRLAYTERYLSDKSQIPLHNKTNPTPVAKREIVCLSLLLLYPLIQIVRNCNSCHNNINHKKKSSHKFQIFQSTTSDFLNQIIPLIANGIDSSAAIITYVLYSSECHNDGYIHRKGIGKAMASQTMESKIIILNDFLIFKGMFRLT